MIAKNVLTYAGLVFIELTVVVQVNMMLPILKHVLVCLSEFRQLPSLLTNLLSHVQELLHFADTTLTLTITVIDKIIISTRF